MKPVVVVLTVMWQHGNNGEDDGVKNDERKQLINSVFSWECSTVAVGMV